MAGASEKVQTDRMQAMVLQQLGPVERDSLPLQLMEVERPSPGRGEVLIKVLTCGVCHTELDEIEGRLPPPELPVIPGHQVVGRVSATGPDAHQFKAGARVGVGWIHHSDGTALENLSAQFTSTGCDVNGGYAEYLTAPERYVVPIPDVFDDLHAAPLLCAGAIGYRALKLSALEDGEPLGLTGFGGSAHVVLQLAKFQYPNSPVYVFTRAKSTRQFALELGAAWCGDTRDPSPRPCRAIIDTTPACGIWRQAGDWSSMRYAKKQATRTRCLRCHITSTCGWSGKLKASPISPLWISRSFYRSPPGRG